MMLMERRAMSNKGGGRTKGNETAGTKHVRLFEDVVAMLTWIGEVKRVSAAQYLDPIIRDRIIEDYASIYPSIVKIKEAQDAARAATGQEPTDPLPIILGLNAPLHATAPAEYPPPADKKTKGKKS